MRISEAYDEGWYDGYSYGLALALEHIRSNSDDKVDSKNEKLYISLHDLYTAAIRRDVI